MKRPISSIFAQLPEALKKPPKHFYFGTSGYRGNSDELLNTLCRASLIAMIRSSTFCGKMIGIMITASHNKNTDNGIKIIDHNGDYIEKNLEEYCDEIVNTSDKDLLKTLNKVNRKLGTVRDLGNGPNALIAIGRDTRESGEMFEKKIKEVLEMFGTRVICYGLVTTPQLHFLVRQSNQFGNIVKKEEYYDTIAAAYHNLLHMTNNNESSVQIDTANGIAGLAINELSKRLKSKDFKIINEGKYENGMFIPNHNLLNEKCGADFIVTNNSIPENITELPSKIARCASFDGDSDRLVYFTTIPIFKILNGDKLAVFLANYFYSLCSDIKNISIGVVLSHYSNSAAINALNDKVCIVTANTGVKNFIKKSRQYDIGIFFEPNGHGSVTFSPKLMSRVDECLNRENENNFTKTAKIIKALSILFDPCVGDAIGNFLVFEALTDEGMFDKIINIYEELPTRLLTVKVRNKNIFVMNGDIEIIEPEKLNLAISAINKELGGRVFVRPSGTEDVVRVFAEANTQDDCDRLVLLVAEAVYTLCDGIGYHPEIQYEHIDKIEE